MDRDKKQQEKSARHSSFISHQKITDITSTYLFVSFCAHLFALRFLQHFLTFPRCFKAFLQGEPAEEVMQRCLEEGVDTDKDGQIDRDEFRGQMRCFCDTF